MVIEINFRNAPVFGETMALKQKRNGKAEPEEHQE